MIYLDNAATTPIDDDVLEAMLPYIKENFGNPSSRHAYGRAASAALLGARDSVAATLGCESDEVYFVSGATEACNTAIRGVCLENGDRGKHIIVSAIEHPAVLKSALNMQNFGFEVSVIPCGENGIIKAEEVLRLIRPDTVLCAVMAANNETGSIQPVTEIANICAERNVFYFCDAVQYIGAYELPLKNISAVAFSAHKIYGPKGIGAMYLKRNVKITPHILGGPQERALRGGTEFVAGAVGLAFALEKAALEREENNKKAALVRDGFILKVLSEIEGAHINGENTLPGFANLSFDGCEGDSLFFNLDLNGIAVSRGSACAAGASEPSHVLKAMGLDEGRVNSSLRFTFGKHNTLEQAFMAAERLIEVVAAVRAKGGYFNLK